MTTTTIDEQARRLVAAVSETARTELHIATLGPRALSDLYLRVRERLRQLGASGAREELVDDLALTVYLAWLPEDDPPGPDLLVAVKAAVARALREPAEEK